jgi:cytochrome c oxidase subunit 3
MNPMPSAVADSISGIPPTRDFADHQIAFDNLPARLRRYRLGLALFIVSIAMLFVGFSSAYVVRRGVPAYDTQTGTYSSSWEPLTLPGRLLILNSMWLLLASFSIEMARRRLPRQKLHDSASQKNSFGWLLLSLISAITFIAGQVIAWRKLRLDGHFLSSGARTAFFYVLTGAHAFHALLGIAFLAALAIWFRSLSRATRFLGIDLAAWYLHAMAVFWIYLFGFLLFA